MSFRGFRFLLVYMRAQHQSRGQDGRRVADLDPLERFWEAHPYDFVSCKGGAAFRQPP